MWLSNFHVRVNIEDYKQLAEHGLTPLITWDHEDPELVKQPGGKCIFLDTETLMCKIYPIRPLDCRNFPYFMPEKNIPSHCLLYKHSSEELKERRRKKTHGVPEFTKVYSDLSEFELEYIEKLENRPEIDLEQFEYEIEIEDKNWYFSVVFNEDGDAELAEQYIQTIKNQLQEHEFPYMVISVLGMNNEMKYIYHIQGLVLRSDEIDVPFVDEFPPNMDDLNRLLDYVNENAYDYLFSGLKLPHDIKFYSD